ncbi:MAG: hypothetical protein F3740_06995 [Nitrospinae bacterium]|nr:hypothetical protein [Nitrospinota bacterium]
MTARRRAPASGRRQIKGRVNNRRGKPDLPFHHAMPQNDEISFNVMLNLKKQGPSTTGYTYKVTRHYKEA